jgi:hypothetical protein
MIALARAHGAVHDADITELFSATYRQRHSTVTRKLP